MDTRARIRVVVVDDSALVRGLLGEIINRQADMQCVGAAADPLAARELIRALHPDETIYTFWDYFRNAWGGNAGLRIDHLLLSPTAATRLVAAGVDTTVRGREKASDHAPVWIELAEEGQRSRPATARRRSPTGRAARRAAAA